MRLTREHRGQKRQANIKETAVVVLELFYTCNDQ